jgi:hypothetical protein
LALSRFPAIPFVVSPSNHELFGPDTFALRQTCPERRSSFDELRMTGVEELRENGTRK